MLKWNPSTQAQDEKALYEAVRIDNIAEVGRLIVKGVSSTYKDDVGITSIIYAALYGRIDILKLLTESGGDINVRNNDGHTAIICAAYSGRIDCLKFLVKSGGDINVRDNIGASAIMHAAVYGRIDCIKLLVDAGGDINFRSIDGKSASDWAAMMGHTESCEYFRKELKWLSRRGFLMFLATQSYLPASPPPALADSMSRDELNVYFQKRYNPETRPNTAVHSVFFMDELQRYIMCFLGPD